VTDANADRPEQKPEFDEIQHPEGITLVVRQKTAGLFTVASDVQVQLLFMTNKFPVYNRVMKTLSDNSFVSAAFFAVIKIYLVRAI